MSRLFILLTVLIALVARADAPASQPALAKLVGQPMKIAGTTYDGKEFSTEQLKGKVVLIDFWATWCGPCVEELPHVKKVYERYHEKGFEIVGISNDYKLDALKKFLAAHPEYPWTQLFDPKAAKEQEWHAVTSRYGIDALPQMFLIDKQGVCRSVNGAADMDQMVPKLLAE